MKIFEHASEGVAYLRTMAKRAGAPKVVMSFPHIKCECGAAAMLIKGNWTTSIGGTGSETVKICTKCATK